MPTVFWSEPEAAEVLGVSVRRVAMYRQTGLLIGIKMNRSWSYSNTEIDRFIRTYSGKNISTKERAIYEKNKLHGNKH